MDLHYTPEEEAFRSKVRSWLEKHAPQQKGPLSLEDGLVIAPAPDIDVLALDEALTRLGEVDPQQSRVVELRFFGGLTIDETAEVLGISPATVSREWTLAKAWLYAEIRPPVS